MLAGCRCGYYTLVCSCDLDKEHMTMDLTNTGLVIWLMLVGYLALVGFYATLWYLWRGIKKMFKREYRVAIFTDGGFPDKSLLERMNAVRTWFGKQEDDKRGEV